MTGVIYARYSSDSQREESTEGQLRECMVYAERSGITIIGNYIDRAMSARTADRPDFQRMINDSEKQLFDAIIVWKLDRFFRDRYDSGESMTDIVDSLNERVIRTVKGLPFRIQNMLNHIAAGIITPATKQRLQDLEARREELNISILQEQLQKPRFTKEQIVVWISRFKYGDPDDLEYQKQIIDNFVNSVYVYDDRLVMTYNYKDGTETISLDAVHQAFGSDLASDAPRTEFGNELGFLVCLSERRER